MTYGDEWKDVNLDDAQDGLYSPEKAKAEFAKAKTALQAEGVQFPIHLDMPVDQTSTTKVQRVQSLKQSLEATLGTDNVVVDIQQLPKMKFSMSLTLQNQLLGKIGTFQITLVGLQTLQTHLLTLISSNLL